MVYTIYTEPAPYGIYHIYVMCGGVRDVAGGRSVVHCIYTDLGWGQATQSESESRLCCQPTIRPETSIPACDRLQPPTLYENCSRLASLYTIQ